MNVKVLKQLTRQSVQAIALSMTMFLAACGGDSGGSANQVPLADAGVDQNAATGTIATLDGSGSSDAEGSTLTYLWSITSVPGGSAITVADLSSATVVAPTFTTDVDGTYVLGLVVNDGVLDSVADSVTITAATAGNSAPVANAGTAQNIATGTVVTLDGSGSSDANGDSLSYMWTFTSVPATSTAALSGATVVSPTFTADVDGAYVLSLVVNDGTVDSAADSVTITAATGAANTAPVANAVAPFSVITGFTVALDGSGSSDADGDLLSYMWTFTSVPATSTAALSNATVVSPTFTADVDGPYVLSLVVNDGTVDSAAATVTITAATANSAPVADAGIAQNVFTGALVTLDGSNSSDADAGDTLTYQWSFTSVPGGSAITVADLSSTTAVSPTFTADVDGSYVLSLVVNDGTVDSAAATVTITAITDNISVDITDNTGPVSSNGYVESEPDVFVRAGLDQTKDTGPTTVLALQDNINTVTMLISYPGTATGVQTFDAVTTTGLYMDPGYFNFEDGSINTGGNIDVTTYGAIGGVFAGTYSMDLCSFGDVLGGSCTAITAVNFAGSFYAQVDENLGSIGNPQSAVEIDGTVANHGMDSSFGTNYYRVSGLTPSEVYSINLAGLSGTGNMDLALTDSTGAIISCDVLAIVPGDVAVAEECQFTADGTGTVNFKVDYVAGATQEPYSISLGLPAPATPVAEGSIATPVALAFGSADLPRAATVDTGLSYYEVTGLTIGDTYDVTASGMSADVDLYVYLSDSTYASWDCRPWTSGAIDETCSVTATGTSMWIAIDGQYTVGAGATFTLDVSVGTPPPVAEGSVASPVALAFGSADLPRAATVDTAMSYYEVTGLTAGTSYDVIASGMSADVDLYVYLSDATYTTSDCEATWGGTVDETCTVAATGTSMWIAIDGQWTSGAGATFTLDVQ